MKRHVSFVLLGLLASSCASDSVDDLLWNYCLEYARCGTPVEEQTEIRESCILSRQDEEEEAIELGCAYEYEQAFNCRARLSRCDRSDPGYEYFYVDDEDDPFGGCDEDFAALRACRGY